MTSQEIISKLSTETLKVKLVESMKNIKLAKLFIEIQEELEKRIGEDELDAILDANR